MTDGTTTQTLASGVDHLPFGPVSGLLYGNGIQHSRGYDLDYRLKTLTSAGTATVQNLSYAYFPTDNIQTITDHIDGSRSQAFGYDALNRLTSASAPQSYGDQLFTYDLNGNRQTALLEGQTTPDEYRYEYEQPTPNPSHRLLEITNDGVSVRVFTPDNNGNTKTAGNLAFTYAQSNRVSQVTDAGSTVGTYTYNGRGERVKTVTAAGTTLFYYGPEGQLLAETDGAGVNKREYVYLDGVPLALLAGTTPTIRTVHTDHLGTPQLLTNPQQAVNWSAHYEPFGKATVSGSVTNNLRFPGQYFDAETGLHYNYSRDLDPETGRYRQSDPIGLRGGLNPYAYVDNNPIGASDPFGLTKCDLDVAVDVATAGLTGVPLSGPGGWTWKFVPNPAGQFEEPLAGLSYEFESASTMPVGARRDAQGNRLPASSYSHPFEGIRFNEAKYAGCLTDAEAADLFDAVVHEGVHWGYPWYRPHDPRQLDDVGSGVSYKEASRLGSPLLAQYRVARAERCRCECAQ